MNRPEGATAFGPWLPDLPYINNPGLTRALNCLPVDGNYTQYRPIVADSGAALDARPQGVIAAITTAGEPEIYAGDATKLYQRTGSTWTNRTPSAYSTPAAGYWRFAQFDEFVIATNFSDAPQVKTIGSSSNFALLNAGAPNARQVGVINRFVMLGDTDDGTPIPYRVQWSAIDDPTDWPTPNTSAARTVQSGEQLLNSAFGAVTGIASGQFYGLVFQQKGITRFTYIGGDRVFQIEEIDKNRGCWAPQSLVQVGALTYFLAADGWYVTDGQSVNPIGSARVDKTFYADFNQGARERVTGAVDLNQKCIYWSYPSAVSTDGSPDKILVYNYQEQRWSQVQDSPQLLFNSYSAGVTLEDLDALYPNLDLMTISLDSPIFLGGIPTVAGFKSNKLGSFSGAALRATFETGETDANPFGMTFVRGIRPIVTGNPSGIFVSLSLRDYQDNESREFSTPVARTYRTGLCDFRAHGRYVSARCEVDGGFQKAVGLEFDAEEGDGI